jgi:hypothetical protein
MKQFAVVRREKKKAFFLLGGHGGSSFTFDLARFSFSLFSGLSRSRLRAACTSIEEERRTLFLLSFFLSFFQCSNAGPNKLYRKKPWDLYRGNS